MQVPAHSQRAVLVRDLFHAVPSVPFWIRKTTDNSAVAALSLMGDYQLTELDGYLPMQLPSQQLDFPRIYEGPDALQGKSAETRVALVNASAEPVTFRLTLRAREANESTTPVELAAPRTFTLPRGGMLRGSISEVFGQTLHVTSGDLPVETLEGSRIVGAASIEAEGTLLVETGELPISSRHALAPTISIGSSDDMDVFSSL